MPLAAGGWLRVVTRLEVGRTRQFAIRALRGPVLRIKLVHLFRRTASCEGGGRCPLGPRPLSCDDAWPLVRAPAARLKGQILGRTRTQGQHGSQEWWTEGFHRCLQHLLACFKETPSGLDSSVAPYKGAVPVAFEPRPQKTSVRPCEGVSPMMACLGAMEAIALRPIYHSRTLQWMLAGWFAASCERLRDLLLRA